MKSLNLTPNEQNSLTKLSLSKIVSNLKSKLKEEETKNQNVKLHCWLFVVKSQAGAGNEWQGADEDEAAEFEKEEQEWLNS